MGLRRIIRIFENQRAGLKGHRRQTLHCFPGKQLTVGGRLAQQPCGGAWAARRSTTRAERT
jgi:hypothetical protein